MATPRFAAFRLVLVTITASLAGPWPGGETVLAQSDRPADERRIRWEMAVGPAVEIATAGGRAAERGLAAAPSMSVRATSWLEYVAEAHAARYFTPQGGTIAGFVPLGWRVHARGKTQPYATLGAGVVWTDFTGLRGIDRRMNYLTYLGGGVRRVQSDGSAVFVEARLSHFSNLSSAPPNLGIEVVTVSVGYRFAGSPAAALRR